MKRVFFAVIFLFFVCNPSLCDAFRMGDKDHLTALASQDLVLIEDFSDASKTKYTTMDDINTYLDSTYQPLTAYLTDLGDGNFTSNFVNTTHPWADNEISSSTNWNTAYTERREWDGGDTHLVAGTGRTSLGLGTAATRDAEDTLSDGSNLPDGHAIKTYGDSNWGGAPSDAKYIVQQADATLSAEQALGVLATGILKSTNGTGAVSIAAEGTDYLAPSRIDDTKGNGDTGYAWSADKIFDQLVLKESSTSNDIDPDRLNGDAGNNDKVDADIINYGTTVGDADTLTLHDFLSGTPTLNYIPKWDGTNWLWAADATGAGGSGSVTTLKENDVQVGGADIVIIDFLGADFDLTESPDTEVQVVVAAAIARDSEVPLDSDFGTNGIMERTGAGTYGIATEGTDYLAPSRIDDTKGNGDTGYVWSADKSFDEFELRCLESVFGTSIGPSLLKDGTVLKASAILQKYHGVDPSPDVLAMLGSANDTAIRTEIGLEIGADVQAHESTLTDIADGTIAENLINEAHPWADNETSNTLTLDLLQLSILTSAPSSPSAGRIYFADNDTWDPCDIAGTDNYYCIYDGADYVAIMDEDGSFFISSVELPSFTHFATGDATYTDTTTPHVLTSEETKNSIITNAGATQDRVYTCPAAEFGVNFMVMVIAAYQMDLEPNGNETLWLNGTQMAAAEHIQNTADTKGDVMSCWSVESGDGTYEIFCKSDNSNWVQATP